MKILVISDSHGKLTNVIEAYEKEHPDFTIASGDCIDDLENFGYLYKDAKLEFIKGNCDYYYSEVKEDKTLEIKGKRILVTHGHLYDVKWGMEGLEKKAQELKVDVVIFGHTHTPYLKKIKGISYFNPGALREKMYGVIEISNEKWEFIFKEL